MRRNALSIERLMDESQALIEGVARIEVPPQPPIATRIVSDPGAYRRWEAEHDRLMRGVAAERRAANQIVALRLASIQLVHRKALFEYLREQKVTGARRHRVFELFHGGRDYVSSVLVEHGTYLRSASSYLCSKHLGQSLLHDGVFEAPLARYEELYTEYFRAYCDAALVTADDENAASLRALVPYLKSQLNTRRNAILAMPQCRPGETRDIPLSAR